MTPTLLLLALVQTPSSTGIPPEGGRAEIEALEFPELTFSEPDVGEHDVLGVTVFHLHDPTLPLVNLELVLAGGVARLGREALAPITALPALLRTGGTSGRTASEVERELDLLALQVGVGSGGGGTSVTLNGPRRRIEPGLGLLADMLLDPAFAPDAVETWRTGEIDRIRRRRSNSGSIAFSEFNRLMYADGPTGWMLEEGDLAADALTADALFRVHARVACRDRLYVGISGDITWPEAEPLLEAFLERWPECAEALPPPAESVATGEAGVFLVPLEAGQSTIVAAHPTDTRLEDSEEYFASRIADFVLGSGGFSSRIVSRMRSAAGLVYQAASVWTTPLRQPGIVGGFAATSGENTVQTAQEIISVLADFRSEPPTEEEISDAVRAMESAFVFAFDTPARIVGRRIAYRLQGLPDDWLTRYLEGLTTVDSSDVARVVSDNVDPSRLTILIAGDPERFEAGVGALGPAHVLAPDGSYVPMSDADAPPRGSQRSPR